MFLDQLNIDGTVAESVMYSQDEFDPVCVYIHNLLIDNGDEFAAMGFHEFWL